MKAIGKLAVDSNAFIAYGEGVAEACRTIERAEMLFMPAIVLGELLYGARNSRRPSENERIVMDFVTHCWPIYVDEAVAHQYTSIRLALARKGRPIPENDVWIAACCLEAKAALLTQDEHFSGVDGLTVIQWMP